MTADHFAEAEHLLTLAAGFSRDDPDLAREYIAAAHVHAVLASAVDPAAGCGDERPLDWGDLMQAAAEAWPDGGMPLLPNLVDFTTALGLVVVERNPDADSDPA